MIDNETLVQLRAAAADLWIEGGIKNVTHGRMEKRTGKPKGHIAHYFKTSTDLLEAAAAELLDPGRVDKSKKKYSALPPMTRLRVYAEIEAEMWKLRNL